MKSLSIKVLGVYSWWGIDFLMGIKPGREVWRHAFPKEIGIFRYFLQRLNFEFSETLFFRILVECLHFQVFRHSKTKALLFYIAKPKTEANLKSQTVLLLRKWKE